MPRKPKASAPIDDALVLTSPPAKLARTAKAKASNRRVRLVPTKAVVVVLAGGSVSLDVNDVLTKNERYTPVRFGKRIAQRETAAAQAYKEAVKMAATQVYTRHGLQGVAHAGLWRLDIVSVWPTQRHHADGTHTANGDADAPVAMVKDALQYAGIIDDDMRIVVGSEASVYEKGVRRTVAVLRPITAEAHAESVRAVLGVLG